MKCYFCKKKINLSTCFQCELCNHSFCTKHRIYEEHKCTKYTKEKIVLTKIKPVKIIKI